MTPSATQEAYARSLAWLAVLAAVVFGVQLIFELVFVDFIHSNPHRPQSNAIFMMMTDPLLLGVPIIIGMLLVFTLPQCFQAVCAGWLVRRFESRAQAGVLLLLPITAVITWYCFDYLTPSDVGLGINDDADWRPYQHGLTINRYAAALAVQALVTLFSVAYTAAGSGTARVSRRSVIRLALAAAIVVGAVAGFRIAQGQYQFL